MKGYNFSTSLYKELVKSLGQLWIKVLFLFVMVLISLYYCWVSTGFHQFIPQSHQGVCFSLFIDMMWD